MDVSALPGHERHPQSLPRSKGHRQEWIDACRGQGQTFSDFDIGGKLTEIRVAGVVAVRAGKSLDWDGEKMQATNAPEAAGSFAPSGGRSGRTDRPTLAIFRPGGPG